MVKVHFIQAFDPASPPNIGKAINDAILQLNAGDEDWICSMDSDILFLQPDTKAHIIEILESTEYDLLSCMTNRIRSKEQLLDGHFSENYDVLVHKAIAKGLWAANGTLVKPAKGVLAAFLLCFRVGTWKKLGGFPEGTLTFDSVFSHRARRSGMKLGIMAGIYVYHDYRGGNASPFKDIKHLL